MAASIPLKIVGGQSQQLDAADTVQAQGLEPRTTTSNLEIGTTLTGAGRVVIGTSGILTQIQGDFQVDGASTITTSETITGTFTVEGDTNLGNDDGDTVNLGGGASDSVALNASMSVGAGLVGIGSSTSDYLSGLWMDTVGGSPAAVNLISTSVGASGALAIGVDSAAFGNSSSTDVQSVLADIDGAISSGASATDNITFTINNDADASTDENPGLILKGGDNGGPASVITTSLYQESSSKKAYLITDDDGTQVSPTLTLGDATGSSVGGIAPTLEFRATNSTPVDVIATMQLADPGAGTTTDLELGGAGLAALVPATTDTINIGTASNKFDSANFSGTVTADTSFVVSTTTLTAAEVADSSGAFAVDVEAAGSDGIFSLKNSGAGATGSDLDFAVAGSAIRRSGDAASEILVTNLLDKSAAEAVTGGYTFSAATTTFSSQADFTGAVDMSGANIDIGGGNSTIDIGQAAGTDTINLHNDLVVGAGIAGIGSSTSNYLTELWVAEVSGSGGDAGVSLGGTGATSAGAFAIGINNAAISNISTANDLQAGLVELDTAITNAADSNSTTSNTYTVNSDAAALTTEVSSLLLKAGNGTSLYEASLNMDTGTDVVTVEVSEDGSEVSTQFYLGAQTPTTASLNPLLVFPTTNNVPASRPMEITGTISGAATTGGLHFGGVGLGYIGADSDGGMDIGQASANRPDNIYAVTSMVVGNTTTITDGDIEVSGGTLTLDIQSAGTGTVVLSNDGAGSDVDLQFTSGASLVRSGASNITVNNLLDKSASETVSGSWTYGGAVTLSETAAPATPTDAGRIYVKDVSSASELFYIDDSGNEVQITSGGSVVDSSTLQSAYAEGSTITVTSGNGSVDIANNTSADTTGLLTLAKSPGTSTAGTALTVTMGANATGDAISVNHSGSGNIIDLQDGGTSRFTISGAGAVTVDPAAYVDIDGATVLREQAADPSAPVANAGAIYTKDVSTITELFYEDDGGQVIQLTSNGTLNASSTLQAAYDGGNTVAISGANSLALSNNTDSSTTDVLTVAKSPASSTAGEGVVVTMGANATGTGVQVTQAGSAGTGISSVHSGNALTAIGLSAGANGTEFFQVRGGGTANSQDQQVFLDGVGLHLGEVSSTPVDGSNKGVLYVKDLVGASELHYLDNGGNEVQLTDDGKINVGLQEAYDAGSTITTTSQIAISSTATGANNLLTLDKSPTSASGGTGIIVQMGANAQGNGVTIDHGSANTGTALSVNHDGDNASAKVVTFSARGNNLFSIVSKSTAGPPFVTGKDEVLIENTGLTFFELASDPVNSSNKGIIYVKDVSGATELFYSGASTGGVVQLTSQGSMNTGLQVAYDSDNTITLDSTRDFEISDPRIVSSRNALDLDKSPSSGSVSGNALNINNGANSTGASIFASHSGSGASLLLQRDGSSVVSVTDSVSIDPITNNNFNVTCEGTGDVEFIVDSEIYFTDAGSTQYSWSETGDRTLTNTASGELFNGVSSVIGGFNAIADRLEGNGLVVVELPVENGVTISDGNCLAASSTSGRVTLANANADTNGAFLGISLDDGTGDAGGTVSVRIAVAGIVLIPIASFTAGSILYLPDGTGIPTSTAPSNIGDLVLRVGVAISSNQMVIQSGDGVVL